MWEILTLTIEVKGNPRTNYRYRRRQVTSIINKVMQIFLVIKIFYLNALHCNSYKLMFVHNAITSYLGMSIFSLTRLTRPTSFVSGIVIF